LSDILIIAYLKSVHPRDAFFGAVPSGKLARVTEGRSAEKSADSSFVVNDQHPRSQFGHYFACTGRKKATSVPPCARHFANIRPLWASTKPLQIERPRPAPLAAPCGVPR